MTALSFILYYNARGGPKLIVSIHYVKNGELPNVLFFGSFIPTIVIILNNE